MYWYEKDGASGDVVLSTRVRFARNLEKTPFPEALPKKKAVELSEMLSAAFDREKYSVSDFSKLSETERRAFVEAHLCSPEFASGNLEGRLLVLSKDGSTSVMINEEDHLRIQAILPGYDPEKAYATARAAEEELSLSLDFAFDERLGYLSCCPTNLGSGMRISVMLHLPALTIRKEIGRLASAISKLGFTIRGMYGEGSEAVGMLYQISNIPSGTKTEEEILRAFGDIAEKIIKSEREAREYLQKEGKELLADKTSRAFGTLKYARLMPSEEFLKNYSFSRLGVSMGIVDETTLSVLDRASVELMPATLILMNAEASDPAVRDSIRAKELKKRLG